MRSLQDEMALMSGALLGRITIPGVRPLTLLQRFHRWAGLSAPSTPLAHAFVHYVAHACQAKVCQPIHPDNWVTLGHSTRLTYAGQGDVVIFHSTSSDWRHGAMGFFLRATSTHVHTLIVDHRSVVRPSRRALTDVRDIRRLEPLRC